MSHGSDELNRSNSKRGRLAELLIVDIADFSGCPILFSHVVDATKGKEQDTYSDDKKPLTRVGLSCAPPSSPSRSPVVLFTCRGSSPSAESIGRRHVGLKAYFRQRFAIITITDLDSYLHVSSTRSR
jgi:hypothetical protein